MIAYSSLHSLKNCWTICQRRFSNEAIKQTALHTFHVSKGGKMVPFAGYSMPVQYNDQSIIQSHLHTRNSCSIFDVSHMLQTHIHGKHAIELIESLTVTDVQAMSPGQSALTLFPNDQGGIEDDLIVTKTREGHIYVVSNAGCSDKDIALMKDQEVKMKKEGKDVSLEFLNESHSLLAIQGPKSMEILSNFVLGHDLIQHKFMNSSLVQFKQLPNLVRLTRCGYTGEDGFEISIPNEHVTQVIDQLLSLDNVMLAGLGARDTLRLEAALCLYGNEMNSTTTIPESGLVWTISKSRRQEMNFKGAKIVTQQIKDKTAIKRVGLIALENGPTARTDHVIKDQNNNIIGHVTSGARSPILNKNIAMAYVDSKFSKIGTKLVCEVRGKQVVYQIVKMPFVPTKYYV